MAGTQALLQVAPDSTGKKIEARQLIDENSNNVLRQVVVLGDPINIDNTLTINADGSIPIKEVKGVSIDGSTIITLGGTAQNLFSNVIPVNGFSVYNPNAIGDLWISDTTTAAPNAAGSIRVAANGGGYETPIGYTPLGPVSIYGATTGQKFTAKRW